MKVKEAVLRKRFEAAGIGAYAFAPQHLKMLFMNQPA